MKHVREDFSRWKHRLSCFKHLVSCKITIVFVLLLIQLDLRAPLVFQIPINNPVYWFLYIYFTFS